MIHMILNTEFNFSLENCVSWTSKSWSPSWLGIETDEGLTDQQGPELSPDHFYTVI